MSSKSGSQDQSIKCPQKGGVRRSSAVKYQTNPLTKKHALEEQTFHSQQALHVSTSLGRSCAVKHGHNPLTRWKTSEQQQLRSPLDILQEDVTQLSKNLNSLSISKGSGR